MLYAPTFRDYSVRTSSLFFPVDDWDEPQMVEFLRLNEAMMLLRPHPNDLVSVKHAEQLASRHPDVFACLSADKIADINAVLPDVDVVITDYSSIYIDLLLSDCPCIFLPYDHDSYVEHRGLAYEYALITPGPKVASAKELMEALSEGIAGAPAWRAQRELVRDMFHTFCDGSACERVSALIDTLVES